MFGLMPTLACPTVPRATAPCPNVAQGMFNTALDFDQDLSAWDVSNVHYMTAPPRVLGDGKGHSCALVAWGCAAAFGLWHFCAAGRDAEAWRVYRWDAARTTRLPHG